MILFQCVETCLKLFRNYFGSLLQLSEIFSNMFSVAEIISEVISAAEIILFQFQTWLCVKSNAEMIWKLFQCFISHVTTDCGYV